MALINDVDLENGLTVENAYHRITEFKGTERQLFFTVTIYVSKEFYNDDKSPLESKEHGMTYDKDRNLFRQMYEKLRSLPEYEDAVEA